jgi:hypothetical protein
MIRADVQEEDGPYIQVVAGENAEFLIRYRLNESDSIFELYGYKPGEKGYEYQPRRPLSRLKKGSSPLAHAILSGFVGSMDVATREDMYLRLLAIFHNHYIDQLRLVLIDIPADESVRITIPGVVEVPKVTFGKK